MISFIVCLLLLITGYLTYGKIVDKTFGPDDRETPAVRINDGVDYVVMPQWKLFLVQLLNIAGLGPIFGALQGALWGPVVFLWITFGTIFAGGVHDYFSGMISERNDGASIAEVTGKYLGHTMQNIMRVFSVVLLIMVGTVFAVGPAGLIVTLCKNNGVSGVLSTTLFWLILILVYYFIATFISIDKIIGKVYGGRRYHRYLHQPELHHSGDLVSPVQHASVRHADLELHVHHGCMRCNFRLPFHAVAADGSLHEEREAGSLRILRRNGSRRHYRTDLGGSRLCSV